MKHSKTKKFLKKGGYLLGTQNSVGPTKNTQIGGKKGKSKKKGAHIARGGAEAIRKLEEKLFRDKFFLTGMDKRINKLFREGNRWSYEHAVYEKEKLEERIRDNEKKLKEKKTKQVATIMSLPNFIPGGVPIPKEIKEEISHVLLTGNFKDLDLHKVKKKKLFTWKI